MKKFLFIALTLFALCSCEKKAEEIQEDPPIRPYVSLYVLPSKLEIVKDCGSPSLRFKGEMQYTIGDDIPDEIKRLRQIYGDTTRVRMNSSLTVAALAYPIDEITICCDKDFDARHKAGEPLDDIALLDFATYYPFIQNGYNRFTPPAESAYYGDLMRYTVCFDCVNADITKLTAYLKPLDHLGCNTPSIKFRTSPDIKGDYTFTVDVTMNGKTMTTTFTHSFE